MIIDAHLHLPVLETKNLEKSSEILKAELKKNGVEQGIIIPDNIPHSAIGDLDECLALLESEKNLYLMGVINIQSDTYLDTVNKLDKLFAQGKIVAIKIFPGHDPIYPTDERLDVVYKLCIKYDKPIVIHTGWNSGHPEVAKYNDPKYIVELGQKYINLKIVIAHYFWPEVDYCFDLTADIPNIYYDTSALADGEVTDATGIDKIKSVLERTISKKPYSVMFGTDYAMCNITQHIDLINSLNISEEEKQRVFSTNAQALYEI